MRTRPCVVRGAFVPLALLAQAVVAAPAPAATVSAENGVLRVIAGPGESNAITVSVEAPPAGAPVVAVADEGAQPRAAAGCLRALTSQRVTCAAAGAGGG